MSIFLKRMLAIPFALIALGGPAFACINDEYTADSETLWGERYGNALEINNITFVVLLVITYSLFARAYFRQKHESYSQDHVFTIFMAMLASLLIFMRIYMGEFTAEILLFFFAIFYVIRLLGQIIWIVWHVKPVNNAEVILVVLTGLSAPILWYILTASWNGYNPFWGMTFMLLSNAILIHSYLFIDHYRYKIYSAMAIVLLFLVTAQVYHRIYDHFAYSYFQ